MAIIVSWRNVEIYTICCYFIKIYKPLTWNITRINNKRYYNERFLGFTEKMGLATCFLLPWQGSITRLPVSEYH